MKVAIIGGKLQGIEAVYLARKANIRTLLIDINPKVPARGLCDEFFCCDVTKKEKSLLRKLLGVNFILPAMENDAVLATLEELKNRHTLPVAFDFQAYAITSSKIRSDQLFRENNIPAPSHYPHCKGTCIAKPSRGSGSDYVEKLEAEEVPAFLEGKDHPADWIIQEYLEGPSYSIEVIGTPDAYCTYPITKIHMDSAYDCNRVTAPCSVTVRQTIDFRKTAVKLAELIQLRGIMDVEVIDHNGVLKVLEIDARLPSQTPAVVYHTSGINLLSELANMVAGKPLTTRSPKQPPDYCSYEHFLIRYGQMIPKGEHIMATASPLHYLEQSLGSDEVISDYARGAKSWQGIFINTADTPEELEIKRQKMKESIERSFL